MADSLGSKDKVCLLGSGSGTPFRPAFAGSMVDGHPSLRRQQTSSNERAAAASSCCCCRCCCSNQIGFILGDLQVSMPGVAVFQMVLSWPFVSPLKELSMNILDGVRHCAIAMLVLNTATPVIHGQGSAPRVLRATTYNSHFPASADGGEAWNGISVAHDGIVYYVLSSPVYNVPAQMYSFNPKTHIITHIANLNDAVGQGNAKEVAQGKSHVSFVEDNGKLYFSTHLGYYAHAGGVETTATRRKDMVPILAGTFFLRHEDGKVR